ncbi:MAG: transposase [Oscillospiraceae bacterium]|nr:transposase [Oscillospiraceae bacterium]
MELPKRKSIRLQDYDYSTPGAYFVTICTHDRRCILSRITVGADALGGPCLQLTDMGKIVERYILSTDRMIGFCVDKYVVMPNHIHMILRIDSEEAHSDLGPPRASAPTVSDAVGALKRLVNRKLGHDIWQRSFHEHVIRNEHDYREIWEYIDQNPAKWAEDRYYEQ